MNIYKKKPEVKWQIQILTPGDVETASNVVVSTGQDQAATVSDAVGPKLEPAIFAKPTNRGFIPQTSIEDGDWRANYHRRTADNRYFYKAKVIGVLEFVDDNELSVPADRQEINSLSPPIVEAIEHHFNHYKDLSLV